MLLCFCLPAWSQKQRWHQLLVDGMGTRWSYDQASRLGRPDGAIEVWIRKDYDTARMAEVFRKYQMSPSDHDVQLWWLLPERRVRVVQITRYGSDNQVLESYTLTEDGSPTPPIAFPPNSVMEVIWLKFFGTPSRLNGRESCIGRPP